MLIYINFKLCSWDIDIYGEMELQRFYLPMPVNKTQSFHF